MKVIERLGEALRNLTEESDIQIIIRQGMPLVRQTLVDVGLGSSQQEFREISRQELTNRISSFRAMLASMEPDDIQSYVNSVFERIPKEDYMRRRRARVLLQAAIRRRFNPED